jgi:hypothetical protein
VRIRNPLSHPLTRIIKPRRFLALATAVLTTAGLVTFASAQPASAAGDDTVCLTNADSYCLGIGPAEVGEIVYGAIHVIAIIINVLGHDNNGDDEDEMEDENDPSLCLTDTGLTPGVDAWFGPCGADGTVWIWVPHYDGYYLYSRYSVDNGDSMVLTVDPLSNGAAVYVDIGANPGGPYWQTFSYY